jgi:hypothetical protein
MSNFAAQVSIDEKESCGKLESVTRQILSCLAPLHFFFTLYNIYEPFTLLGLAITPTVSRLPDALLSRNFCIYSQKAPPI